VESCGLDSAGSGERPVIGSCEHSNKPSGSVKGGEFLDLAERILASQVGLCSMESVSYYKYTRSEHISTDKLTDSVTIQLSTIIVTGLSEEFPLITVSSSHHHQLKIPPLEPILNKFNLVPYLQNLVPKDLSIA
jgi:hypothetical protein